MERLLAVIRKESRRHVNPEDHLKMYNLFLEIYQMEAANDRLRALCRTGMTLTSTTDKLFTDA